MRTPTIFILAITVFLVGVFSEFSLGHILTHGTQPMSPHGDKFRISCSVCHSPKSWKIDKGVYSFNHGGTKMPLVGQHINVDCRLCHQTLVFSEAKTECVSCHADVHESTVGPQCNRCHTPQSWLVNNITNIHQQSRFPLIGVHSSIDCSQCHKSESFRRFDVIGAECFNCHSANYAATTQPNHAASGFSRQCNDCHTIFSGDWKGSGFDHSFFPLSLGHASLSCIQCHTSGKFTKISNDCYACHQTNFNTTTNPNHQALGFSTTCTTCHSTSPGWKPTMYDHSKFPLTQGHAINDCAKCHTNGNFTNTSNVCSSCHLTDFNATTNPNHMTLGFSTTCTTCHSTAPGWKPTTYDHSKFPLTQGHAINDCMKCHVNGNYTNTAKDCYACHQTDYNASTNPNHKTMSFSTTCTTCHTTAPGWKPTTYNHSIFPLTQGHAINDCMKCHVNGNYTTTSNVCSSCHLTDFNATTNPNHKTLGFSTTCTTCHSTIPGWKPTTYNHSIFPLTQGHAINDCAKCHVNGNYTTTSKECSSCHISNYNATTNPSHQALSFPTTCLTCHTTLPGWKPASYDHSIFPLTQGHAISDCAKCHVNGNYTTTSKECSSCHISNYNATTNPSHQALSFPTTCLTCHTTLPGWKPASYTQHDALSFPIYSGKHRGQWTNCTDCHANTGNYKVFSCIDCHEHNKTSMDSKHSGKSGYAYNSISCLKCHPKGSAN